MLVILAILAAILVPALLGWIDEAKKKQTVLEARNVYIATQTVADEQYAKANKAVLSLDEKDIERIEEISDVEDLQFHYLVVSDNSAATVENMTHGGFTVVGMAIEFTPPSKNGETVSTVYAQLDGDTWEVYDSTEGFVEPSKNKAVFTNPKKTPAPAPAG